MRPRPPSLMGENIMAKQLAFDFSFGGHKTPTFSEWYSENCTEKRRFGERQYTREEGQVVYNRLVKTGFFDKGFYNA